MDLKKNPEANLERKKGLFFFTGLVCALAVVLISFEWKNYEGELVDLGALTVELDEEEMIPITQQETPPPPPPPPPQTQIVEIVEDDEEIEEELEIEDTEVDEDTEVEIVEVEEEEEVEEPTIFTIVEDMPSFKGCETKSSKAERDQCTQGEILKFLGKNLKYPPMAKDAGIQGIVYVNFVINEKGGIDDVKILRGIGGGCDEAAVEVVKRLPKFNPGKQRGKAVKVSYNLPVRFVLR